MRILNFHTFEVLLTPRFINNFMIFEILNVLYLLYKTAFCHFGRAIFSMYGIAESLHWSLHSSFHYGGSEYIQLCLNFKNLLWNCELLIELGSTVFKFVEYFDVICLLLDISVFINLLRLFLKSLVWIFLLLLFFTFIKIMNKTKWNYI